MANGLCLIANHGYYYTPHFVNNVDGDTSLLAPFHQKHVVTRIPDTMYRTVIAGMAQVMETGTGARVKIPGLEMCGKTGTAQNPHGRDHSLFEAFAPRVNPKIAIAVVVENAGFGATYAAPIASLMIEKYLRDTIAAGPRTELMNRMKNTTILPEYLIKAMKDKAEQEKAAAHTARAERKMRPQTALVASN
jgi:penicillin-binding protein 2